VIVVVKTKMKRRSSKIGKKQSRKMKGALSNSTTRHLQLQLGQVSLIPLNQPSSITSSAVSRFQNLLDSEPPNASSSRVPLTDDAVAVVDDRDCILSQDFFWYSSYYPYRIFQFRFLFRSHCSFFVPGSTPDYITPDNPHSLNGFDCDMVMYFKLLMSWLLPLH